MISNKLINDIPTIPFLHEIKGLKRVSRVPLHKEDLTAHHRDELRTNNVKTALKDLAEVKLPTLLALTLATRRPEEQQEREAEPRTNQRGINTDDLVLDVELSDDLTTPVELLLDAAETSVGTVTHRLVVSQLAVLAVEPHEQVVDPQALLLVDLQQTLEQRRRLQVVEQSLAVLADDQAVLVDETLVLPQVLRLRRVGLLHTGVNIIVIWERYQQRSVIVSQGLEYPKLGRDLIDYVVIIALLPHVQFLSDRLHPVQLITPVLLGVHDPVDVLQIASDQPVLDAVLSLVHLLSRPGHPALAEVVVVLGCGGGSVGVQLQRQGGLLGFVGELGSIDLLPLLQQFPHLRHVVVAQLLHLLEGQPLRLLLLRLLRRFSLQTGAVVPLDLFRVDLGGFDEVQFLPLPLKLLLLSLLGLIVGDGVVLRFLETDILTALPRHLLELLLPTLPIGTLLLPQVAVLLLVGADGLQIELFLLLDPGLHQGHLLLEVQLILLPLDALRLLEKLLPGLQLDQLSLLLFELPLPLAPLLLQHLQTLGNLPTLHLPLLPLPPLLQRRLLLSQLLHGLQVCPRLLVQATLEFPVFLLQFFQEVYILSTQLRPRPRSHCENISLLALPGRLPLQRAQLLQLPMFHLKFMFLLSNHLQFGLHDLLTHLHAFQLASDGLHLVPFHLRKGDLTIREVTF